MTEAPKIHKAMLAIQRGIHAVGIGKFRKNAEQKFNFRGIDDALAAFAPLLTEHGVYVAPSYRDHTVTARATKSGGTMFNVTLAGTFTFTADDGSERVVGPFYGEASDSGDKATSKATSVAYRNALFVAFCVPHEPAIGGDPDGQGGEVFDEAAASWLDAINDATTIEEMETIGAQLKEQAPTIAADSMKVIRREWAAKAKTVKAAQ